MEKLNSIGNELGELEEELVVLQKTKVKELHEQAAPPVNSLAEWFGHYGQPQRTEGTGPGWRTRVDKDRKVYGGTNHHMPFKTVAATQRPGRLTR